MTATMNTISGEQQVETVRIGTRLVGADQPTLIVAEAGVNHDGSVDRALRLVDFAHEAGADVVKFQVFQASELASAQAAPAQYQRDRGATSQREMLRRLELSDADFARIREHCAACGIEFLATPFGPHDVQRLTALDVRAIKIASADLTDTRLLSSAAGTGLPLIVSTGAASAEEIGVAVAQLRDYGAGERLILLHCVSGYPAPLELANLRAIDTLRQTFGVPAGFSDHTESVEIAGWAVAGGACVLEKHFTLDRTLPGPDQAMSLGPSELVEYVAIARQAESARGTGAIGCTAFENAVRSAARKSIVAATTIRAGAVITPELLTLKRPGDGLGPNEVDRLIGRRARCDIDADTLIRWEDVQ